MTGQVDALTTPQQMREHVMHVTTVLGECSRERAAAADHVKALACQWVSDLYRVQAALWNRAAARPEPFRTFFEAAELVLTPAAANVAPAAGDSAEELLARLRDAFQRAAMAQHIPVVFPRATHLAGAGVVDLGVLRGQVLGDLDPPAAAAGMLERARGAGGPAALRWATAAYLVDVAGATGDVAMVTAAARMVALERVTSGLDLPAATGAVRELLGPVEWVRAGGYLRRGGLDAA